VLRGKKVGKDLFKKKKHDLAKNLGNEKYTKKNKDHNGKEERHMTQREITRGSIMQQGEDGKHCKAASNDPEPVWDKRCRKREGSKKKKKRADC